MRRVIPVVLCVAAFYAIFASMRAEQYGVLWFVHLGSDFLSAAHSSHVIHPSLGAQSTVGYDGQYYFALAADPAHAHDYIQGSSGVIYSRVFYPAASRAASLGSVTALPYAMLIINLLAVLAGTTAVALWLIQRSFSPWPALLYGLFPGLVFTAFRDLTEPLAFGLAAVAVLAFDVRRTRRLMLSALLFACGVLTRETIVPFALAGVAVLALEDRRRTNGGRWHRWRRAVAFAVATCGPLLLWRLVVTLWINQPTQEVGHERGWILPLHGIWSWWPFDSQHWLIVLVVTLPTLAAAVGALVLLRQRRCLVLAGLLLVNVLLYVVWLPRSVYVDYAAASRAAIGVVLAALFCLPAWWRGAWSGRVVVAAGAFTLSLASYLIAAELFGLRGIRDITM